MCVLRKDSYECFDWTHFNIFYYFFQAWSCHKRPPVFPCIACYAQLLSCTSACQSSFSSSFPLDFFTVSKSFSSGLNMILCCDTWIACFVISISMLSSSISLLWPQLTHITHSSQIVGPTMGTLLHLSFISWLGKSPTHSDCRMYTFCSDSPNSQVLLRAPQMLCSIRRQTISNLSPPMRCFLLTNLRQPRN